MLLKLLMALLPKKQLLNMFTIEFKSQRTIQSIIDDVEIACAEYGFALLHHYNYHEVVASKGFPINRKVYIYEVCQAKVASMVLTSNPHFAPFMPCRIAVYEEGDTTIISTQNMQMMIDSIQSQMQLHVEAIGLFIALQDMMKKLKG
ncbi:MAG: DUF302 domain-containing protein [Sulfuricurvum sp.]|nr:DUF302 domain-containing protein [Sulfuricurvum sp.]MDP3022422.1 DUF302 domain-containing protein [Sulfuricurvum sp.]